MTSVRVIPVSAVLSRVPSEWLYLQKWVTPPLSGPAPRCVHAAPPAPGWRMMAPFLEDELWVLIVAQLAEDGDVRSLGRLACVSRRFNAKAVPLGEPGPTAAPEFCSVVVAGARRATCAGCCVHVASCAPQLPGQPVLRLLWERVLLSRAPSLTAVGPARAAQRTELSDAGSVAHQPRMPMAEQRAVWASSESEPAFALVPSESSMHTATCVVLEWVQLAVGDVPLRAGRHYVELELTQNSLVPSDGTVNAASTVGVSTTRFGVVSGPLAWSGIAPHALWSPVAQLNPRSRWAQFTDARNRSYFVREQSAAEIAEHDSVHQVQADDVGRAPGGSTSGVPVSVDPTFASEDRVMNALSYEAVASLSVPPEGVQVKLKDEDTDDYYFDSIPGKQWFFDTVDGDLVCAKYRSSWVGQRAAKEKDCVGLLLDIEAGTLDVYLNSSRLGTMARGLKGLGPFRFVAEIFTDARVRIASKPAPLAPSSAAVDSPVTAGQASA